MKSLFDKAAEYGSKAKTLAGGYLQGEKGKRSPEVEEVEKIYHEKFMSLKKEIDTFQIETIKNCEEKFKHLNDLINKLNEENEATNIENKKLSEDNKNLKQSLLVVEKEKSLKIKELEDKLITLEEKYLNSEKIRNELSAEVVKVKENQIKEGFLLNYEEMKKKIEECCKLLYDENKVEKFLKANEDDIQNLKNKLDEYADSEEKEELTSLKENIVNKYIEAYHKISLENFSSVLNQLNEFKNVTDKNLKILNDKLIEHSTNSEKINSENLSLKDEISSLREENLNKIKQIEEIETILKINHDESEKAQIEFNKNMESLTNKFEVERREKDNFAKAVKETQEFIKELENEIQDSKKVSADLLKEKEGLTSNLNELEEEIKQKSEQLNKNQQTFKQFFLLLLEEDVFIDVIEKIFKSTDNDSFFEEIYKLSKLIKPKIIYRFYNEFLSNEELVKKISKYNLEVDLEEILKKYKKPLTLDFLNKLASGLEEGEAEDFITQIIQELTSYIENLNSTIMKQGKNVSDLNNQLKSVKETLEESKRNDSEKYELLNKHIVKLQQDCRENQKTEKLLRENIEHLENLLRDSKLENEKLHNKLKSFNTQHEELTKEKNTLKEKILNITQQCDLFKVENLELSDQNQKNLSDNQILRQRLDSLLKEKDELSNKISELEKLKNSLNEKSDLIKIKEQEIIKLNNTHADLEDFIENLKSEKEQNTEIFKKQIMEMAIEIETLKETNRLHEDRLQNEPELNKNIEDLEKMITDLELENKHLKEQKDKMKKYSEEILLKVKNDLKETEYLVDKRMISNLILKYFDVSTSEKLKYALLDTLANFMAFNNSERRQIGLGVLNNNNQVKTTSNASTDKLKDLSDDLYNFILNS